MNHAGKLVSVSFCCNNPDNGVFNGKFCSVSIGAGVLSLDNQFYPPKEPGLSYDFPSPETQSWAPAATEGRIKVSRKWFSIHGYKYGYGNWCWDCVLVTPETTLNLLNYLGSMTWRGQKIFQPEHGFSTWFDWWLKRCVWAQERRWLKDLEEHGYQRP